MDLDGFGEGAPVSSSLGEREQWGGEEARKKEERGGGGDREIFPPPRQAGWRGGVMPPSLAWQAQPPPAYHVGSD